MREVEDCCRRPVPAQLLSQSRLAHKHELRFLQGAPDHHGNTAGTFPPLHRKNEIVEGYLDPLTNEVRSIKESKIAVWCIAGLVGLGTAMLLIGLKVANSQIFAWIL